MKRILCFCLALFVSGSDFKYADFPPKTGTQTILILRVIDGDTVEVAFLTKESIRLHGINAHEINSEAGKAAKSALEAMIGGPGTIRDVELMGKEKFGRTLGDFTYDGKKVSNLMIGAGHARPWDGKGAKP